MADQFRADALGAVGGYTKTPVLDRLARQGTLFRRAVTNSPECIPARFALATGLYPSQTGVFANHRQTLSPEAPSWMRALAKAGYHTSLFGKSHLHGAARASHDLRDGLPLMRGYGLMDVDEIAGPRANINTMSNMTDGWRDAGLLDRYREDLNDRLNHHPHAARPSPLGFDHYYDTYVGRQACRYLTRYRHYAPWFCWVSFAGPHEPWDAPAPFDTMFSPADMPPAIERGKMADYAGHGLLREQYDKSGKWNLRPEDIAAIRANYAGNVALIDEQIGHVLDAIEARGESDRTVVVFTSDHGEMNGDHGLIYKSNFLAPAVDIPLIVRVPETIHPQGAAISDALVELMDVGATIVDYAGATPDGASNARSLGPVLRGQTERHRSFVCSEFRHHTMIADERWKVVYTPDERPDLIFDRAADPGEVENLVEAERRAEIVASFEFYRKSTEALPKRQITINAGPAKAEAAGGRDRD